jgi:hypothetical protein
VLGGVTAKDLAVMAATLAAGGKNPTTGKQIIKSDNVPESWPSWRRPASTTTPASGCTAPACRPRAASAVGSSPCRLAIRRGRGVASARCGGQQRARAARDHGDLESTRRQSVRALQVTAVHRRGGTSRPADPDLWISADVSSQLLPTRSGRSRPHRPLTATAYAQKTDIVTLRNGDRITGEVEQLDRGRLEYSTDDGGTIYFEWDKVVSVQSKDQFEVGTSDGRRFLGTLSSGGPQLLVVTGPSGPVTVATSQVTMIDPIGRSFWSRVDGSLDIGFSYTKSSSVTQLNANSTTTYRKPRSEFRVTGSATLTDTGEGDEADDRGTAQASYLRYRGQNMYFSGGAASTATKASA